MRQSVIRSTVEGGLLPTAWNDEVGAIERSPAKRITRQWPAQHSYLASCLT
jgi:hypothetical protein